jgi:hypothetical protein
VFLALDLSDTERQSAYRALFRRNWMKKRLQTSGLLCHRACHWGMVASASRFVRQRESGVRRGGRGGRLGKRISWSSLKRKPILDSEQGGMDMGLSGKNNVKLTPLALRVAARARSPS